jgi:glycosyltransferase involved in cell wall biosynthesis
MYKGLRIAVAMPIHNEQNHIARAISRVPEFVDLIVAVDDGSTDHTWKQISQIEDCRLIALRHETNRGVGAATKTAYRYALNARADLIAVMDGDGQMDGRDLYRLLDAAIDGADYVKGNRFLDTDTISSMPILRYLGNRVLSKLTQLASRFSDSLDAQCGYAVIHASALKRLNLDELYDRYGFPNEMLFAACRAGLNVKTVPVRSVYEDEVSGINPFTAVPTIFYLILRSRFQSRMYVEYANQDMLIQEGKVVSGD